eukprot:6037648-Alexandrium_andersonii.AAC.1
MASRTSTSSLARGCIPATFSVSQVQNPILAVVQLQSPGLETVFKPTTAFIKFPRNNRVVDLAQGKDFLPNLKPFEVMAQELPVQIP